MIVQLERTDWCCFVWMSPACGMPVLLRTCSIWADLIYRPAWPLHLLLHLAPVTLFYAIVHCCNLQVVSITFRP